MNARLAAHAVLLTAVVWTHAPLKAATLSHGSPVDDGMPSLEFAPKAPPPWMQSEEVSSLSDALRDGLPGPAIAPAAATSKLPPSFATIAPLHKVDGPLATFLASFLLPLAIVATVLLPLSDLNHRRKKRRRRVLRRFRKMLARSGMIARAAPPSGATL